MNTTSIQQRAETYKLFRLQTLRNVNAKVEACREYVNRHNIKHVVVGVSGGIDSAVVLGILARIPEVTVHAVTIKYDLYNAVFDNSFLQALREHHANNPNVVWHESDLTSVCDSFLGGVLARSPPATVTANVSYAMRYLAFFAIAQATGGITFGTTNRDEMGYVGWFGKSSDMVVDVQPIADLHKFEVVEYAMQLGVPQCIIDRTPSGDLLDGSSDEANFGCTYDELAYLTHTMSLTSNTDILTDEERSHFAKAIALHNKNAHKYQGQTFNPVFIK